VIEDREIADPEMSSSENVSIQKGSLELNHVDTTAGFKRPEFTSNLNEGSTEEVVLIVSRPQTITSKSFEADLEPLVATRDKLCRMGTEFRKSSLRLPAN